MINSKKTILLSVLLLYTINAYSYDVPQFSSREIGIGISAFVIGIAGAAIGTSHYHSASLEHFKLKQVQEAQQKKELAEQTEKERQHAAELQKLYALNLLSQICHTYAHELEQLRKEKLQARDELLTIITEKCGMKELPLNQYHVQLLQTIESLRTVEAVLPAEKQQERALLMENLERILKVYNSKIADKAKQERDEAENKRKKAEAEQRKEEKEKLELRKLYLEIDTLKETQKELAHIQLKLDAISNKVTNAANKEFEHAQEIIGEVKTLRVSEAKHAEELKKITTNGNEAMTSRFAVIFQLAEQLRNYLHALAGQQHAPVQPQSHEGPPPSFTAQVD